ncbi:MAG: PD40 domain-containing protein, partial [Myxococcales bacterium]|nr:PD40 domain-containing protein [Myxococcales bacterium]
ASFGSFAGARVTVQPRGGKAEVRAACGTLSGTGELIVNLTGTIVDPSAPPNAGDIFGGATPGSDPARTPAIEYPIDRAVSPRNIPSIEMQWKAAGNDLFHVTLTSSHGTVHVYTADVESTLSAVDWEAVAGTAAGEDLQITVEGLATAAPTTRYASTTTKLTMSTDKVDNTAIYYWASSKGNIMSQTFGATTEPELVKDGCTSCHSVSRSGSRIGYSRCIGGNCDELYAGFLRYDDVGQTWKEAVNANDKKIRGSYTTFAPTGNPFTSDDRAIAMVTLVDGSLALYDPDSGAAVPSNIAVAKSLPNTPKSVMMADWSPDGRQVVYAATPNANDWIDLDGGRIATMSYNFTANQHVFGTPRYLVPDPITLPSGTYTNFFFPSFSPDGAVIVFNAARARWRDFDDAARPGQRLMLTDAAGTNVTDLTALNGGDADSDITWAHWSPAASNDYYWIVFSSERDYGHEITAGNTAASCKQNGVKQCKQIWIGAVAKNKLGMAGVDPSAAPMWLPGQDTQTDNISPFWSVPAGLQ